MLEGCLRSTIPQKTHRPAVDLADLRLPSEFNPTTLPTFDDSKSFPVNQSRTQFVISFQGLFVQPDQRMMSSSPSPEVELKECYRSPGKTYRCKPEREGKSTSFHLFPHVPSDPGNGIREDLPLVREENRVRSSLLHRFRESPVPEWVGLLSSRLQLIGYADLRVCVLGRMNYDPPEPEPVGASHDSRL